MIFLTLSMIILTNLQIYLYKITYMILRQRNAALCLKKFICIQKKDGNKDGLRKQLGIY